MMSVSTTHTALVSTNSITQGEAAAILWKPLMAAVPECLEQSPTEGVYRGGGHIDFAHRTFRWSNENKKGASHWSRLSLRGGKVYQSVLQCAYDEKRF